MLPLEAEKERMRMNTVTKWEVSHPCDECRVEASFFITKTDSKNVFCHVQEDGSIYYSSNVRCEECGVISTHIGIYEKDWM